MHLFFALSSKEAKIKVCGKENVRICPKLRNDKYTRREKNDCGFKPAKECNRSFSQDATLRYECLWEILGWLNWRNGDGLKEQKLECDIHVP